MSPRAPSSHSQFADLNTIPVKEGAGTGVDNPFSAPAQCVEARVFVDSIYKVS